jgi:hypothetical protein
MQAALSAAATLSEEQVLLLGGIGAEPPPGLRFKENVAIPMSTSTMLYRAIH